MSLADINCRTLWTLVSATVSLLITLKCRVFGEMHAIDVSELMMTNVLGTMVTSRCLADRMGMCGLNSDTPPRVLNRSGLPGLTLLLSNRMLWVCFSKKVIIVMVIIITVTIMRLSATCQFLDNLLPPPNSSGLGK